MEENGGDGRKREEKRGLVRGVKRKVKDRRKKSRWFHYVLRDSERAALCTSM